MLNDMGMKCLFKNFLEMVLVLIIPQHNVHQIHIMQVLLIIMSMVFEKRDEKYDLLILLQELSGIMLLQHNLMKYEITAEFWFGLKKRKKKQNNDSNSSNDNNSKQQNHKMFKNGINTTLLCASTAHYTRIVDDGFDGI